MQEEKERIRKELEIKKFSYRKRRAMYGTRCSFKYVDHKHSVIDTEGCQNE